MTTKNAIAEWRNMKKVSQQKLANHLGVNRVILSQIELGNVIPTDEMLVEISRFLDCLITDLKK